MPDEQQFLQLDPAVRELLTNAQAINPDIPDLAPEDLNEQAAARQQSEFARRYLSRDIDAESRQRSREELPKNRVLRALFGMGEGVRKYNDPKFETAEERTYNRMMNEYAKQAPVLQRDLSAFEATNARIDAKRQDLALKTAKAKNEFNLGMQGVLQKYAVQLQRDKLLQQKVLESISKTKNLDVATRLKNLEAVFTEATGTKMGTAGSDVQRAYMGVNSPELASGVEKIRASDAFKSVLGKLAVQAGKQASAGQGYTTSSQRTAITKDANGQIVPYTATNTTTKTPVGGGGQAGANLDRFLSALKGNATVPPAGAKGGVGGTESLVSPPQGASPVKRLLNPPEKITSGLAPGQAPPKAAELAAQAPASGVRFGKPFGPKKALSPAVEAYRGLNTELRGSLDKMIANLTNPANREHFATVMGPGQDFMEVLPRFRSFTARDTPQRQAEKELLADASKVGWGTALKYSGKAINTNEQKALDMMFLQMTKNKMAIVDKDFEAVGKLIQQRLMASVLDYKMDQMARLGGESDENWAKVREMDFSTDVQKAGARLLNKWRGKKQITADDFAIEKIAPGKLGSKSRKWLEEFSK